MKKEKRTLLVNIVISMFSILIIVFSVLFGVLSTLAGRINQQPQYPLEAGLYNNEIETISLEIREINNEEYQENAPYNAVIDNYENRYYALELEIEENAIPLLFLTQEVKDQAMFSGYMLEETLKEFTIIIEQNSQIPFITLTYDTQEILLNKTQS